MLFLGVLAVWVGLSLALGLPLAQMIRRADVREFPLRDTPWWCDGTTGEAEQPALQRHVVPV